MHCASGASRACGCARVAGLLFYLTANELVALGFPDKPNVTVRLYFPGLIGLGMCDSLMLDFAFTVCEVIAAPQSGDSVIGVVAEAT